MRDAKKTDSCPTCKLKTVCSAGCPGESRPTKSRKPKAPTAAELLASIRELYARGGTFALPWLAVVEAWPEVEERKLLRTLKELLLSGKVRNLNKATKNGPSLFLRPLPEPKAPPAEASPPAAAAPSGPPEPDPGTGGPATPGAILEAPGGLDDDEPRPLPVAKEKSCSPPPRPWPPREASGPTAPADLPPRPRHPLDGPDNPAPEDLPLVHLSWPHVYLLRALGGLTAPTTAGLELVARELEKSARHAREILARCHDLGSPADSQRLREQVREAATEYQVALRAILPGEGLVAIQEPARCLELALEALRGPAPGQVTRGTGCSSSTATPSQASTLTSCSARTSTQAPTPSPSTKAPAAGWTPGPLPVRMPWSWEACRAILRTLGRADLWTPAGPTAEARAILEAHPAPGGAEEEGPTPAAALRIALTVCATLAGERGRCDLAEVLSLETAPLRTVALALLGQAATGEPSTLLPEREAELDEAA